MTLKALHLSDGSIVAAAAEGRLRGFRGRAVAPDGGAKRQHLANFVATDALKIDDCRPGAIVWVVEPRATRAAHAGTMAGRPQVQRANEPAREASPNPRPWVRQSGRLQEH